MILQDLGVCVVNLVLKDAQRVFEELNDSWSPPLPPSLSQIFLIKPITKTTTIMPGHDHQRERYQRCLDLFKAGKYAECVNLCLDNLTDPNMTRALQIKTLIVISNATGSHDESDGGWQNVEVSHARNLL
jgi:hypothetical protein